MRPIRIEFQAFGPYKGHEVVDLEALSAKGLFLICGKTGIGKTTILDAMTFALYGKSSGNARDDFNAMRCTKAAFESTTFVKFEFENNDEYYLFERRLERKRKNLAQSYNLMRKENGAWQPMMENAKERALNEKAVEIIGLEYEQFRQVIVLPQGQFEKFLTSNSNEKEEILTSIFGEEKWQRIAELFYSEAEERKKSLHTIKEKIQSSLDEEQCETLQQLELMVARKNNETDALDEEYRKKDLDALMSKLQDDMAIAKRFGDLEKDEERLSMLDSRKDERKVWAKRLEDAKRAQKVRTLLEDVKETAEALDKRKYDEAAATRNVTEKSAIAKSAADALKEHLLKAADTEEKKELKVQYESRRGHYENLDDAVNTLTSKRKAVSKAEKEELKEKAAYEDIREAIIKTQDEYNLLKSEHEALLNDYLSGITGVLAGTLKDGEPCPVCGSREHPDKAPASGSNVTSEAVEEKKADAEEKYIKLQDKTKTGEAVKAKLDERHAATESAKNEAVAAEATLESLKKNLVSDIGSLKELESAIEKLDAGIRAYLETKEALEKAEAKARDEETKAKAMEASAREETKAAEENHLKAKEEALSGLKDNGFDTEEEALSLMLSDEEMDGLSKRIANHDSETEIVTARIKELREELKGRQRPDGEKCKEALAAASEEKSKYEGEKAVLTAEASRLAKKLRDLRQKGEGMEEKIRDAEEDFAFAKKLRGDSGTGIQRYVLGIMFSSVVSAANRMLELVHGGRYSLYRSDDKAQGSNKRGLELKVYDRNSEDHEGRFVSTLSGGEKFLVSLALSIGMSVVAQKSGIKIEALFIDEGFGSLDDESISDAMNVLDSIQQANGIVGIISHVQILQERIPVKLRIEEHDGGSRMIKTIG